MKFIRPGIARKNSSHIKFLTESRMRILRSARKDQFCWQNLCGFMFRWEMIDSMLPFGARQGNLYIGRTQYGSRPVINISPATLQGSAWAPKGNRPAPLDTVRCPIYLLTKIGKRNRTVTGRLPADPLMQPPGLSRVVYGLPVWTKRRENGEQRLRHTGFLKLSQRPWNRKGAKISIFTRCTGPGSDLWKPQFAPALRTI